MKASLPARPIAAEPIMTITMAMVTRFRHAMFY
jgi:hypothetical protein